MKMAHTQASSSSEFPKCPLVADFGTNKDGARRTTKDGWIIVDKARSKNVVFARTCNCSNNSSQSNIDKSQSNLDQQQSYIDQSESTKVLCDNCRMEEETRRSHQQYVNHVLSTNKPYVPITVEELSATKNLDSWVNCNVRVIGRLQLWESRDGLGCTKGLHSFNLQSVNEAGGPYRVCVDLQHTKRQPMIDEQVQAFGEITIKSSNQFDEPVLVVFFHRNMEVPAADLALYCQAIEQMKKFVPMFIKQTASDTNSQESNPEDDLDVDLELLWNCK